MPRLECSVTSCRYNQNRGCVRENISVGGAGASSTSETCCDSFEERRGDSFMNSSKEPSERVNIRCEAKSVCTTTTAAAAQTALMSVGRMPAAASRLPVGRSAENKGRLQGFCK